MLPAELTTSGSQPDSPERRAQIDDFLRLLEAARRAADAGETFSVALLAPARRRGGAGDEAGGDADAEAANAAHEFLRLNLRRADSVAFYGPTLLVALLPRDPRRAGEDLARLLDELEDERPSARLAFGLASFPEDAADVETVIERADAQLNAALNRRERREDSKVGDDGAERAGAAADADGEASTAEESRVRFRMEGDGAGGRPALSEQSQARRGLPPDSSARRAVRESRRGEEFEAAVMSYGAGAGGGGVLGQAAAEAAAREREMRSAGVPMPRRVLLTVSDPARMAQINLLLRSAAYEVRAAFDGGQALDLLRIERADLLVLDYDLKVLDGPAVLRRLHERHRGLPPPPVALLLPPERDTEQLREEARACGAAGFVRLPYDPAELLECVRTAGGKE